MYPTPERRPPRTTWWSWLLALVVLFALAGCMASVVSTVMPLVMP